jgi:hypothetical protein
MKRIIIISLVVMAIAATLLALYWPRRSIFPVDDPSARRSFIQSLARQHSKIDQKLIVQVPTDGTWVSNCWVFAVRNARQPLLGGPTFDNMFLIGGVIGSQDDGPTKSRYVTRDFDEAITRQLDFRPPTSTNDALAIAECYAWLSTHTSPTTMMVLKDAADISQPIDNLSRQCEVWGESVRREIVEPRVEAHRLGTVDAPVFTVELCTYSPDFWGDVYFWHMEIGKHVFSVSKRPIFLAPRVLE